MSVGVPGFPPGPLGHLSDKHEALGPSNPFIRVPMPVCDTKIWKNTKMQNEQNTKNIFIFGGGEIYKLALNFCSQIELTLVDVNLKKGVSFPFIDKKKWKKKNMIFCFFATKGRMKR